MVVVGLLYITFFVCSTSQIMTAARVVRHAFLTAQCRLGATLLAQLDSFQWHTGG